MFYTDCGTRCEYKDKPQRGSWIFCSTSGDGTRVQIKAGEKFAAAAPTGLPADERVTLRVVPQPGVKAFGLCLRGKGDIIDTCIDQRRTMITRRDPEPEGDRLFFFARGGAVTFESIEVRPLP
jgi:hypothetical protein